MIFIDVSGACKSPRHTGIQRITRNICRELREHVPITPISWNRVGNRYQLLGQRERNLLKQPFQVSNRPIARPEIRGENFLAELHRQFFRAGVRLNDKLGADDVLLVPDIYRDGRLKEMPRLLAQTRARTVAIFHDAAALDLPQLYPKAAPRFRAYIESLAAFDLVICVSNASRAELLRLWSESSTAAAETVVETWPVESSNVTERDGTVSRSSNLIVCVGSFEPRKNHLRLLRAAEKLWNAGVGFELELIGRSSGDFGANVVSELRRLQRARVNVRWSKQVNDQALHHGYRECRFTVYPSLMEGFGLPILESLSHGKPVICGGNGALGEVALDGGCLIVDQTDEEALASAMKKLLTDQVAYERLCNEAHARKFRSWADYIDNLLERLQVKPTAASVATAALQN
jgi:glycosyltransferase involved in cell wall biosynthesis